jgi:hypothetical protein
MGDAWLISPLPANDANAFRALPSEGIQVIEVKEVEERPPQFNSRSEVGQGSQIVHSMMSILKPQCRRGIQSPLPKRVKRA